MTRTTWHYLGWIALVIVAAASSLFSHPLIPIDETRYAAVAWEMWARSEFLVPYLNGEVYSHKGPVLFWLMHLGWAVFGLNEWWPRVVPVLFALATVFLTHRMALKLWPEDMATTSLLAPALLLGTLLWMLFIPLLMFDIILGFWVLLAVHGLLSAHLDGGERGWILFAIATALGILTKGPVMLLHVTVPALLMPMLLSSTAVVRPLRWYLILLGALIGAVMLALCWAIPAALQGGPEYARAILWGQTSGRMVDAFAHGAAWWWYLVWLPLILFPWLWWPALWRSWRRPRHLPGDPALRFSVIWVLAVFVAFSLISGKRVHYLIPLIPVIALFFARLLALQSQRLSGLTQWPIALFLVGLAGLFAVAPALAARNDWPEWIARLPLSISVGLVLLAVLMLVPLRPLTTTTRVLQISSVMIAALGLIKVLIFAEAAPYYDTHAIARVLQEAERAGIPVAHIGKYHGQFGFYGRLTQPIEVLNHTGVDTWVEAHPGGLVIVYYESHPGGNIQPPVILSSFRGKWVAVWHASDFGTTSALGTAHLPLRGLAS